MDNELYLLSLNLRAVAHVLHFAPSIDERVKDRDFISSLMDVISDYLYAVSDRTLEKISCNFTDSGFDRRAVFGDDFFNELRHNSEDVPDCPEDET